MMGRRSADRRRFFYDFRRKDHLPAAHLPRRIDGLLDLGEVRGGNVVDMLEAMNTGHDGSLCTAHANENNRN